MKNYKFKDGRNRIDRLFDWLNAVNYEGMKGSYIALFRHFLFLLIFCLGMLAIALWILKM